MGRYALPGDQKGHHPQRGARPCRYNVGICLQDAKKARAGHGNPGEANYI